MAHCVKVSVPTSGDLSWIPGNLCGKGENESRQVALCLTGTSAHTPK